MKFDLHVHSTFSDGIKTVMELGREAKDAGLGGFALTDHDTIDGWNCIREAEAAYGITIFPGVEISTEYEHRNVHILGYCIKDEDALRENLKVLADSRKVRAVKIIEKLQAAGFDINYDEVCELSGDGTIGRPHIASVLTVKGYVKSNQQAFDKYLNRGKPFYVDRIKFTPMDAIKVIKEAGGYAVLAHPGLDQAIEFLDLLCECGLDGMEVHHSSHNTHNSKKLAEKAVLKNLAQTAGSDYHGHTEVSHGMIGSVALGKEELPYFLMEYLEGHQ